jgi:transposase
MARFVEGDDRSQVALLPECLDDFVADDNPVRVVDAFVGELDLRALGFDGLTPASTGRPSYHPAALLKIYIYGYLNRIQSSRRLERECQRNLELMWLTGRLAPDFKTIADFRHASGDGIQNVCRRFVVLCRELKLFSQAIVAIDGSKFKAVNKWGSELHRGEDRPIPTAGRAHLDTLETADRTQPVELQAKTERLQDKIKKLRKRMRELDELKAQLKSEPDEQLSLTDPDARSMATSRLGSGSVGYNVQMAVDGKHHLIVAHNVTNDSSDRSQFSAMALATRDAMGKVRLQAHADRGYYNSVELKACDDAGIAAYVPKSMTSNAKAEGRFDKSDFIYIARDDEYKCPAGQRAIYRYTRDERGLQIRRYWSSACPQCPIKAQHNG